MSERAVSETPVAPQSGGGPSPLEVLSEYLIEAKGSLRNNPTVFRKLQTLFEKGRAPERVEGHFYGVTLAMRTGNLPGSGNVLNHLWGRLLASHPPWVGKGFVASTSPTYSGINFFLCSHTPFWTRLSIRVLRWVLKIEPAPEDERKAWGCDYKGGRFVARKAKSVYPGLEKEVFQLDYRLVSLGNPFPLKYLIDEIVEIDEGLYLGPLLFATRRLFRKYDPSLPAKEYRYANFGYFLLMSDRWDSERRRLFPYTEDRL
ncbi:MAG: hypothetical protein JNN08_14595 [Bryobacterales bacterium]|nr:hypothetical protein [Bryobacterales bacterium]